ncbi:glycosyltransferase [Mesobacillus jeotgali]|uniref:glycosyltransferase n=1 Tax=Mesobacillus jeotgali TaxID=129985 RepID=UPI00177F34CF|nr:glycosyltransferase [Mesobacillus jeotgali]UYZ21790.1 hypothetical protein FOF60_22815 [Mesobacillus jeotgali]
MKVIAYYISDYGYGHASRSIAIIRELLLRDSNIRVIVCHSFAVSFMKASILSRRVSFRELNTDIGYFLKKGSIYPDKRLLFEEYLKFINDWDSRLLEEEKFLKINHVDLVISDISPLPFEPARNLGIPSIGLSNFTWFTAYQGLIEEAILTPLKEVYSKITYFFSLAGSNETWGSDSKEYGFFSRKVDLSEINSIRNQVDKSHEKKIVFLGLGMKIDQATFDLLPIWDSPDIEFVISSNVPVKRENVQQIPLDYVETQNYIASSDLVITKAGWGMVGEALNNNVPLLILERRSMTEDQSTINYLKKYSACEVIDWNEFKNLQVNYSFIDRLNKNLFRDKHTSNNSVNEIAEDILKILYKQEQFL